MTVEPAPVPLTTLERLPVAPAPLAFTVRLLLPRLTAPVLTFTVPVCVSVTGPALDASPPLRVMFVPVRLIPAAALASRRPVKVVVPPAAVCVIDAARTEVPLTLVALAIVKAPRRVVP